MVILKKTISALSRILGVDFHIFFTLLMRLWTVVAGGVMIIGIPLWFTPVEQGYYFTFSSILGLQVFFELGFNYVITQLVGHETARLNVLNDGNLTGDVKNLDRLSSLIKLVSRWYKVISVAFFSIVCAAGYVFFSRNDGSSGAEWKSGWILLAFFTGINLFISPFLAFFEGIGKVGHVARLRFLQSILGYTLLWAGLSLNFGLRAVPLLAGAATLCSTFWLIWNRSVLVSLLGRKVSAGNSIGWRKEIFPFQWRIAVSWISGYLIFQLFNPMIFAYQGAKEAGRAGLALVMFSTLLSVSMSWVTAKAPTMAAYVARGEEEQLRSLFRALVIRSGIFNVTGCLAIVFAALLLKKLALPLSDRIASIPTLLCLTVVTVANHYIFSVATFLRSHKKEPLLTLSVATGVLSFVAVFVGARLGVFHTMLFYSIVTACISLPWCMKIFKSYK